MARPATLPGIWGALAAPLGVSGLAETLGTNPRTLNNWARNVSPVPAIEAGLLADLCEAHGVRFVDVTTASRTLGAGNGMLIDDGLHPSATQYAEWTRLALPAARAALDGAR